MEKQETRKLKIKDVPQDYIEALKKRFEEDERIRRMRIEAAMLQKKGQFVQALQKNRLIERCFNEFIAQCLAEADKESQDLTIQQAGIPQKDAEEATARIVVLYMMLDIIDSVVMDVNDILKRTNKDYSFIKLETIRELAKETRYVLRGFEKSENYMVSKKWGDIVDNVYNMIVNKAKKLIKKE